MNIGIDARYVREKPSGIGTYVEALVERLSRIAPQHRFLLWVHPRARRPLVDATNIREVVVWPKPNSPRTIWWPLRYAPFDGLEVFHSPHNTMARGLPCPSVVTVHDLMAIERPDLHLHGVRRLLKSTYYPQAVWRAVRSAARIITHTNDVADRICRLDPAAAPRVRVISPAAASCFSLPANRARAEQRARTLTGTGDPYLLVVGANSATKRHADVIMAMAAVPSPWRLVLLQREGAHPRLARLARRAGVAGRIVWIPSVDRADVVTLMQCAGALVQPSLYEGFGLPIVEAMACGCPVVASDIPVFREVTGGAALFAPPGDVSSLGQTLRRLASSASLREDLSAAGVARAARLSWDRNVTDTVQTYVEAAGARN